jgi:hypothetical protein
LSEVATLEREETAAIPTAERLDAHKEFFHRTTACFRPQDGGFRPRPDMLSVNGQILHVTAAMEFFLAGLVVSFDRLKPGPWVSRRGKGASWIGLGTGFADMAWTEEATLDQEAIDDDASVRTALKAFDGTMDIVCRVFAQFTPEEMTSPLPRNPLDLRSPQHVLDILLDHTAHHRGALAQYARLLGHDPSIPYFDMSEAIHEAALITEVDAASGG